MSKKSYKVAIVGATGLVGRELLELLRQRRFPVGELFLYASWNTAGEKAEFMEDEVLVKPLAAGFHQGLDIVFFTAHPMVSRDLAEQVAQDRVMVIDSSRSFRLEQDVPLVVPELNRAGIAAAKKGKHIIASPSPAAVALSLILSPLHQSFGVQRVVAVTTHGSTTEGRSGYEEHQHQVVDIFNAQKMTIEKFSRQCAFNIFPRVGSFTGDSSETELDIEKEIPKIMSFPELKLTVTAAAVPIFCGISIAANVELSRTDTVKKIKDVLKSAPGVKIMDQTRSDVYPDTIAAMASEEILVGRIRKDPTRENAINLWISADNLRKGSALNMIQIAEELISLDP